MWSVFEALAPTWSTMRLPVGDDRVVPIQRAANVRCQHSSWTVVQTCSTCRLWRATAIALGKAIPHAQQRTLEGQTHDVNLEVSWPRRWWNSSINKISNLEPLETSLPGGYSG